MADERKIVMRPVTWLLIGVAIVLFVIAIFYFTSTAANLPSFFPGHSASSNKHIKHGLAALLLAFAALAGAWFTTAPKKDA
jgi:hypothetical protein